MHELHNIHNFTFREEFQIIIVWQFVLLVFAFWSIVKINTHIGKVDLFSKLFAGVLQSVVCMLPQYTLHWSVFQGFNSFQNYRQLYEYVE